MPKRILIADDEPDAVQLLEFYLQRAGFELAVATDGEQAVQLARETPPDLIVLDLLLPKRDGFEVCKALRGEPRTARVPVLMLTAFSSAEACETGLELGADDYLVKASSPREIVARINKLLERGTTSVVA